MYRIVDLGDFCSLAAKTQRVIDDGMGAIGLVVRRNDVTLADRARCVRACHYKDGGR